MKNLSLALLLSGLFFLAGCGGTSEVHEDISKTAPIEVERFQDIFYSYIVGELNENEIINLNNLFTNLFNYNVNDLLLIYKRKYAVNSYNDFINVVNSDMNAYSDFLSLLYILFTKYNNNMSFVSNNDVYATINTKLANPILDPTKPPTLKPPTPSFSASILGLLLKGKTIGVQTFDLDIPTELYVNIYTLTPDSALKCLVDWGDGTIKTYPCSDGRTKGFYRVGPFYHKYEATGKKTIQVWLKLGNNWNSNKSPSTITPTISDNFKINFYYNGDDSVFMNSWSFNYTITDEISEEPYMCTYSFYFVDPPSNTLLGNFGPVTCPPSGRSPVVRLFKEGVTYSSSLMLAVDMVVSNANNSTVRKRLTTSVLPPVRVYIKSFSISPSRIAGRGSVEIKYDGRESGYPYGARATCELWVDGILTDELFPCNGSLFKDFTNPRNYTVTHDITFKIYAQVDYGNGDIIRSEASKTLTLYLDPFPANVAGECYVQSRAGGPYDRQVGCSIEPSGEMPPGTYSFTASSAYVCPTITKYVHSGDNIVTFKCHR